MSVTDLIVSAIMKKGILGDLKGFKTEIEIPDSDSTKKPIRITITADNLQVKFDKEI